MLFSFVTSVGRLDPTELCCAFIPVQVHSAVEEMDGLDDVENSMLYYNQAVILYHLRQYTEAIIVGEKLYQFLEPFGTLAERERFLV